MIRSRPPLLRPPLAVKYEEIEADVPSLPKLRRCASNVYSVEIIKKMELAVLIELDWDLASVASARFLEAVLALTGGGTFPHDDVGDRQWTTACAAQLRKLAGYLHSICLQDAQISAKVPASQLAAAIVATARVQLHLPGVARGAQGRHGVRVRRPRPGDERHPAPVQGRAAAAGAHRGDRRGAGDGPVRRRRGGARWDDDDGAYGEEEEEGAPPRADRRKRRLGGRASSSRRRPRGRSTPGTSSTTWRRRRARRW